VTNGLEGLIGPALHRWRHFEQEPTLVEAVAMARDLLTRYPYAPGLADFERTGEGTNELATWLEDQLEERTVIGEPERDVELMAAVAIYLRVGQGIDDPQLS